MNNCGWDEIGFLNKAQEYFGDNSPVLLDVGANVGDFTDEFLHRFPKSICHCFEPNKEIFDKFVTRFLHNKNVYCYNIGLYNENINKSEFYYVRNSSGMSSLHYRPVYFPRFDTEKINVDLVKLDAIDGFPKVDYVKIDTEGSELMVLSGAEKYIKENKPKFIQYEYGGCYIDSKTTGKDVVSVLNSYGYTVYNNVLKPVSVDNFLENYDLQNYLAVME